MIRWVTCLWLDCINIITTKLNKLTIKCLCTSACITIYLSSVKYVCFQKKSSHVYFSINFLLSWEGILYFFAVGIILLIGFGIIPHIIMIVCLSATRFSCVTHCLFSFLLTLVFVKIDYDNLGSMLWWPVLRLFYGWKNKNKNIDAPCCVKARAKVIVSWWVELNWTNKYFWGLSLSLCDSIKYY